MTKLAVVALAPTSTNPPGILVPSPSFPANTSWCSIVSLTSRPRPSSGCSTPLRALKGLTSPLPRVRNLAPAWWSSRPRASGSTASKRAKAMAQCPSSGVLNGNLWMLGEKTYRKRTGSNRPTLPFWRHGALVLHIRRHRDRRPAGLGAAESSGSCDQRGCTRRFLSEAGRTAGYR